ncbi:MAG TPA: M56 family metallopeptidase [Vicinamibacterales bacterium]|nr:M56 family metallopeptidase [Vicinamibacterales bacterium]
MSAIAPLLQQPAAQAVGWALLHFVWQGTLIGLLSAVALLALRRSAADIRYLVSAIGLTLMLTMPAVTAIQTYRAPRATALPVVSAEVTAPVTLVRPPDPRVALSGALDIPSARSEAPAFRVDRVLPMFVLVWIAGVMLLTLRLITGWMWAQRLRTHGVTPVDEGWQQMLTRLARRLHVARAITLLESALVEVPTVIGWAKPVVLLPASALAGLTPQQLEAILAHELAHIRRHDYLVNLLQTLVETLLFYHPAVWWLSHRIRIERENCCDDLAVSLCGDPVAYAAALADLESLRGPLGLGRSGVAMAADGGSLLHRVRRLLGAPPSHSGRGPAWLAASVAILVLLGLGAGAAEQRPQNTEEQPQKNTETHRAAATEEHRAAATEEHGRTQSSEVASKDAMDAMAAAADRMQEAVERSSRGLRVARGARGPLVAADQARAMVDAAGGSAAKVAETAERGAAAMAKAVERASQSISHSVNGSSGTWVWSNDGEKLAVKYRGEFEFTDDDADVSRVSQGGWMQITDGGWFGRHTVEIKESGGKLERRYWVNGSERPYDPEGKQWLREKLPTFVRNTGIGAPKRVARFLKSGGPSAVLTEIGRIDSSYVKRIYFSELFKQATLDGPTYARALDQAGREIDSDYEKASLLVSMADRLPEDAAARAAYFKAASNIDSDYELRRVYSTMLKRGPVSPAVLAGILQTASSIDSDYELSQLLQQIVKQQPLDATSRPLFYKAASSIASSYERHHVLSAAISRSDADPASVAAALQAAGDIDSDYEASNFLQEVLKKHGLTADTRPVFFKMVSGLSSGYELRQVLTAVVAAPGAHHDDVLGVLQAAQRMSGGYDLAEVLIQVAQTQTLTGDLRDAYLSAADRLPQGYEQGRVMTALVRSERR